MVDLYSIHGLALHIMQCTTAGPTWGVGPDLNDFMISAQYKSSPDDAAWWAVCIAVEFRVLWLQQDGQEAGHACPQRVTCHHNPIILSSVRTDQ